MHSSSSNNIELYFFIFAIYTICNASRQNRTNVSLFVNWKRLLCANMRKFNSANHWKHSTRNNCCEVDTLSKISSSSASFNSGSPVAILMMLIAVFSSILPIGLVRVDYFSLLSSGVILSTFWFHYLLSHPSFCSLIVLIRRLVIDVSARVSVLYVIIGRTHIL